MNTDTPALNDSEEPSLAASGDCVYVTWRDTRNNLWDIYVNRSMDRGSSWLTEDVVVDADPPAGSSSTDSYVVASGDSVYLVWLDDRNGEYDIYFNIPFGAQAYGEGTQGFGGHIPQLTGTDSLNLGSTFTLTIQDALGGAFGFIAMGGPGSKASIPLAGGQLLVSPIENLVPVLLNGSPGMPGEGSLSLDIPIPDDSAFIGFNVNLQAAFVDPTATQGVVLTNGVEAWIF
jgi:hypothetical protein